MESGEWRADTSYRRGREGLVVRPLRSHWLCSFEGTRATVVLVESVPTLELEALGCYHCFFLHMRMKQAS